MLNVKQFNKKKIQGPISDSFDPRLLFMSALVPVFYWLSIQEVLTVGNCWLMVVSPCPTCTVVPWPDSLGTSDREGEWISSMRHPILRPIFLHVKWYQRAECVSRSVCTFNDVFSLVSHSWKASSLLWSTCLSQAQAVEAGPRCSGFSSGSCSRKHVMMIFDLDLQRNRDHWNYIMLLGNIWFTEL